MAGSRGEALSEFLGQSLQETWPGGTLPLLSGRGVGQAWEESVYTWPALERRTKADSICKSQIESRSQGSVKGWCTGICLQQAVPAPPLGQASLVPMACRAGVAPATGAVVFSQFPDAAPVTSLGRKGAGIQTAAVGMQQLCALLLNVIYHGWQVIISCVPPWEPLPPFPKLWKWVEFRAGPHMVSPCAPPI